MPWGHSQIHDHLFLREEPRRTVVVGDVHGCFHELRTLLSIEVGLRRSDRLVLLGDIVDKGPFADRCVRWLRHLSNETILVLGNHEERFLRWMKYEDQREKTGKANPMKFVPQDFALNRIKLDAGDMRFLRGAVPAFQFHSGDRSFLCVHAGIPSRATSLPTKSESRKRLNPWIRLRYRTPEGKFVRLGEETPADFFWAEKYDGRFGHAFFGHQPWEQRGPKRFEYATGLDGGCVHGNRLLAAVVENGNVSYHGVRAHKSYAEKFKPSKATPYESN